MCRDGSSEVVIRGENPVILVPVLPRWLHEGREPVQKIEWREFDDARPRPRHLPGKPDESVLMYRIESHDPSIMMPTIGRSLVQEEAVAVVRVWIKGPPATPQP
jgi:hypothetical protein